MQAKLMNTKDKGTIQDIMFLKHNCHTCSFTKVIHFSNIIVCKCHLMSLIAFNRKMQQTKTNSMEYGA